jgi:hypothetical protein
LDRKAPALPCRYKKALKLVAELVTETPIEGTSLPALPKYRMGDMERLIGRVVSAVAGLQGFSGALSQCSSLYPDFKKKA